MSGCSAERAQLSSPARCIGETAAVVHYKEPKLCRRRTSVWRGGPQTGGSQAYGRRKVRLCWFLFLMGLLVGRAARSASTEVCRTESLCKPWRHSAPRRLQVARIFRFLLNACLTPSSSQFIYFFVETPSCRSTRGQPKVDWAARTHQPRHKGPDLSRVRAFICMWSHEGSPQSRVRSRSRARLSSRWHTLSFGALRVALVGLSKLCALDAPLQATLARGRAKANLFHARF